MSEDVQKLADMFAWTGLTSWEEFVSLPFEVQAALVIAGRKKCLELAVATGRATASMEASKAILIDALGIDGALDLAMSEMRDVVRTMP